MRKKVEPRDLYGVRVMAKGRRPDRTMWVVYFWAAVIIGVVLAVELFPWALALLPSLL